MGVNTKVKVAAVITAGLLGFLATEEGTVKKTYRDPVGIVTACTGHTAPDLRMGMIFTDAECRQFLNKDTAIALAAVERCVKYPISVNEKQAYTSFTFNTGAGNFCSSTLARKANAGDRVGACYELTKWVWAGPKGHKIKLPGLVTRRDKEMKHCLSSVPW